MLILYYVLLTIQTKTKIECTHTIFKITGIENSGENNVRISFLPILYLILDLAYGLQL